MAGERPSTRKPLADQMYDVLLAQFMAGERKAGEPLNIGALTRELNVSQTPLREALARLEHTGLVRRVALKGYRVAPALSERDIVKLMEARLALEPTLTYEAGRRTTPEFLDQLRTSVEVLDEAVTHADTDAAAFQAYWQADDEFHQLIAAQSDNEFLLLAYRALTGQIQRFRLFSKRGRTGISYATAEHRAIYEAMVAHDSTLAENLMREHIIKARDRNIAPR